MKAIITIVTFCLLAFLGFWIDSEIVKAIMDEVPKSSEWLGLIKIGVWVIILFFTTGLIFGLSAFISGLIYVVIKN
jgi:uncharacterized protein involved in cysteine biosynthesis